MSNHTSKLQNPFKKENKDPFRISPINLKRQPFHPIGRECEEFQYINLPDVRPDAYLISNYGNIYSNLSDNYRKLQTDKDGYSYLSLIKPNSNDQKYCRAHRIVAFHFCEIKEGKDIVNHINGIKNDNYYKNLEFCTVSENNIHAFDTGLKDQGEDHFNSIYTNEEIHLICKYIEDGLTNIQICNIFGYPTKASNVAIYELICRIRNKRGWKSVSCLYNF